MIKFKKYNAFRLAAFILMFLTLSSFLFSQDSNPDSNDSKMILAGSEFGYPPFCIVNNEGAADGFSVELLREALNAMDREVRFTVGPWNEVKQALEMGEVEALPLVGRSPEREDMFDFTFPYLEMTGAIVVHKDTTSLTSIEDLQNKTIAVLDGDNAEEYAVRKKLGSQIVTTSTPSEALSLLNKKEVDAVLIQRIVALQIIKELGLSDLRISGTADFKQSFCFAVQEGNNALLAVLNEGLAIVTANGTYDELYSKWFGPLKGTGRVVDRIIIGGDSEYPPYEFLDENGVPTGFNVDLTRAIAEEIGVEVEIVLDEWSKTYAKLLNEEIDIAQGVFFSLERDKFLSYSTPHSVLSQVIVTRENEHKSLSTMEDLKGLQILVMEQDIMHQRAKSLGDEENIIAVASQELALSQLSEGVADCALVAEMPALYWIEENSWDNLSIRDQVHSLDYSYAALEGSNAAHILMEFSEGLSALKAKGTYREISNKWFSVYEQSNITFRDVLRTFSFILIPIMLVIFLVLFWSFLLRKQVRTKTAQLKNEISEKEAALNSVAASEKEFREYIQYSPIGIFLTDEEGNFLEVNPAVEKLTGYRREELLSMNIKDFAVADEQQKAQQVFQELINNEILNVTLQFQRKDGTIGNGILDAVKISETEFLGFTSDISNFKQAEKDLKESETRFRALHNASFGGITIHDKGKILECNKGLSNITGYSYTELIGMDGLLLIAPDYREFVMDNILSGYEKPYEAEGLRKNGDIFPLRLEARNIPYKGKNVRVVEFRDITDIKQAEEKIIEDREKLSVTLHSIGDGVISTDIDGNIQMMNRVAVQLTGWTQAEALGKPIHEVFHIIHEYSGKKIKNPLEEVIETGSVIELSNHTMLISKAGKQYIIADSGAPIRDKESRIIGMVLVFRDVTKEAQLNQQIQQTAKLDSLGILAGGIAHDFNNMLSGIFGFIDLAKEAAREGKEVIEYLEELDPIMARARHLTQQLLTFSRGGTPIRETRDIKNLIKESTSFALSGANIKASFNLASDLWPCNIDPHQIEQVIDNIVINALQAMPAGGKIAISAENIVIDDNKKERLLPGGYVHITFEDTGIGIPQNILDKIFDPFFTTKEKGHGLGLATCYSIIQKHEGLLFVESQYGEGTIFHIYLPKATKDTKNTNSAEQKKHEGEGRIMLLDDESYIRTAIGKMLESMGYEVEAIEDGQAVIDICTTYKKNDTSHQFEEEYVAAFFDLTIPNGIGGKDIVETFREICPDIPVFAISGYSSDDIMAHPKKYGFTNSLTKPFSRQELEFMLNTYLGNTKLSD